MISSVVMNTIVLCTG